MPQPDEADEAFGTLSHIDRHGRAKMVDVSAKDETKREAIARGRISMRRATLAMIQQGGVPKGDVFAVAQIAGVMAAKRAHELIPLCHPLLLTAIDVKLEANEQRPGVEIQATIRTTGKTGVEMEAMTAVAVAALTIYDMCKAVDRAMKIDQVRLIRKAGGKSGEINLA
jgi:cyclic pyranopterin phosphate synthase